MKNIIPETIEAAYSYLDTIFAQPDSGFSKIKQADDMTIYHHTLGRWIRNNWGFWTGSKLKDCFEAIGFWHADDMSGALLRGYWCHKYGVEFNYANEIMEIPMNSPVVKAAIKKVAEEIAAMPQEELKKKFKEHKTGDVAKIIKKVKRKHI